jgi:hypothetical protein
VNKKEHTVLDGCPSFLELTAKTVDSEQKQQPYNHIMYNNSCKHTGERKSERA